MESYEYLFPYEKIQKNSKVVIYGAGLLGKEYLRQIQITRYCEITGFLDRYADKITSFGVPIYLPEVVQLLSFDKIVIALRSDHFLNDVKRILSGYGISDDVMVFVGQRNVEVYDSALICPNDNGKKIAYERCGSALPVSLNIRGGIGDMVIAKRFVEELICLMPNCLIDIYCIHDLSWLYSDCSQINEIINDNAVLYQLRCKKYALSITIKSYYLELDYVKSNLVGKQYEFMLKKLGDLQKKSSNEKTITSPMTPKYIAYMRRVYNGYNCYTGYSYGNIFDINDSKVHIPLLEEYEEKFYDLSLHRYITVNFGNGDSEDMHLVAKAWPLSRFNRFIDFFKLKYPHIQVVQIGGKSAERIRNADRYILGESFELVKYILKNSVFHVDIEGGLVHLATQLGTKCIVLFGPTNEKYFGYPQNINVKAGNCHDCYGLYNDLGRCARDMQEPECMYSITPEMVMEKVEAYMEKTVKKDYVKYRICVEKLGLKEPLIVGLRDNSDIITDIEIVQDEKNDGTFVIKCYLNPAAGIQSADDARLRFACENIIGNLSLCTKAHVGNPEYIEGNIAEKKSCIIDFSGTVNVGNSQESLEEIKDQLCWNHRLNEWEVLYRMAMLSKDDVTRFILLYAIINGVLESGGQRKQQGAVDSFIRQKCGEKGKNDYIEDGIEGETIYTSLRNAISHAKPERETKISDAYAQIHNKVAALAEMTLWAIEEVSNSVASE